MSAYVLVDVSGGWKRLYSEDVSTDRAEAEAWAADVNTDPPATPWGPLHVSVFELTPIA